MYLQMTLDGRVSGSDAQTPHSEYLGDKSEREHVLEDILLSKSSSWDSLRSSKDVYLYVCVPGVLELKSVKTGEIVIKGLSSSLFLCMDSDSHLRGQVSNKIQFPPRNSMVL